MDWFLERAKAVVTAVGGLVVVGWMAWSDHVITSEEVQTIIGAGIVVLTALGVYHAKNKPQAGS